MTKFSPTFQEIPLKIVGGNNFGRYPKISVEQTWNMIISDGWLVPFAGHKKNLDLVTSSMGRGLFSSIKSNNLFVVIEDQIFRVDDIGRYFNIGLLETISSDVFIDENDNNQIAFCDQKNIYIYDTVSGVFTKAVTPFTPIYIAFHDGYFIAAAADTNQWYLSGINDGFTWSALDVGLLQTKPDNVQAVVRMPGMGNQIFVMGRTVTEGWQDVGAQLFPYQKNTGFGLDYGCISSTSIAFSDNFIIWLGANEKSGPVIMYSSGGPITQISNDGINFKFAQLKNPKASYGSMFKQDGHLIYIISFVDPADNYTLAYDFNTQKFFYLSDEEMNHHIAKKIVFFNNSYYFISFNDGNLYELNSEYTTFDGHEIPRIRITDNIRSKDASPFIANNLTFTIEQGENSESSIQQLSYQVGNIGNIAVAANFPTLATVKQGWLYQITATVFDNDPAKTNTGQSFVTGNQIVWNGTNWTILQDQVSRVDLCISNDGGVKFSSNTSYALNRQAYRRNRIIFWNLGRSNDLVCQFRFGGLGRFVATDGFVSIYQ